MAPRKAYSLHWVLPDKIVSEDCWLSEGVTFDKTIPFLGENSPKPVGFRRKGRITLRSGTLVGHFQLCTPTHGILLIRSPCCYAASTWTRLES